MLLRGLVEQHRIVAAEHDRDVAAAPPACCERKVTRASGIWLSCGASARSNSLAGPLALAPCSIAMTRRAADADAREDALRPRAAARSTASTCRRPRSVCSSVVPGTISIVTLAEVLVGVGGRRSCGSVAKHEDGQRPARRSRRRPSSSDGAATRRSRRHIAVHQPAFAMLGMALGLEEIGGDHRRDQARDGEADQHRDDDGEAEIA